MIKQNGWIITGIKTNKPFKFAEGKYAIFFRECEAIDFCNKCSYCDGTKVFRYRKCSCVVKLSK